MEPFLGLLAAVLTLLAVPFFRGRLSGSVWMDRPKDDRHHRVSTPRVGGPAWLVGFVGSLVVWVVAGMSSGLLLVWTGLDSGLDRWNVTLFGCLFSGTLTAAFLGWRDEAGRVSGRVKGGLQVTLLLGTCFVALVRDQETTQWVGTAGFASVLLVLAIAAILQLALNIFDNMDGVLAGAVCGALLTLALVGSTPVVRTLAVAGLGATAGFLVWNRPPARSFFGNMGSHATAYLVSALVLVEILGAGSLHSAQTGTPSSASIDQPLVSGRFLILLPVAWPLFDLIFVVTRRILEGRHPWEGGRDHSTHVVGRRLGSDRATFLAVAASAIFGALVAVSLL